MPTYRCPTDANAGPGSLIGCGYVFGAEPDLHDGFIDCPNCGMWFAPRPNDVVKPGREVLGAWLFAVGIILALISVTVLTWGLGAVVGIALSGVGLAMFTRT